MKKDLNEIFNMLDLFYANKHLYNKLQTPRIKEKIKKRDIFFLQRELEKRII